MSESNLLTVTEVAQVLRVDDTTVRRWIKNSTMKAITLPHVGKRNAYRIHRNTLEKVMNQTVQTKPA